MQKEDKPAKDEKNVVASSPSENTAQRNEVNEQPTTKTPKISPFAWFQDGNTRRKDGNSAEVSVRQRVNCEINRHNGEFMFFKFESEPESDVQDTAKGKNLVVQKEKNAVFDP